MSWIKVNSLDDLPSNHYLLVTNGRKICIREDGKIKPKSFKESDIKYYMEIPVITLSFMVAMDEMGIK